MKRACALALVVVSVLIVLAAASLVLANAPTITQVVVDDQAPLSYDTEYAVHLAYTPHQEATVTAWVPDLDIYDVTGSLDAGHAVVSFFVPAGTPPGDYLVRFAVYTEDGSDTAYRYITVQ